MLIHCIVQWSVFRTAIGALFTLNLLTDRPVQPNTISTSPLKASIHAAINVHGLSIFTTVCSQVLIHTAE